MKKIITISIIIAIILIGCFGLFIKYNKVLPKQQTVVLYFSDGQESLVKENRNIVLNNNEKIEKRIIEELIKGPLYKGLYPVVPKETKVNNVLINNDTATVDLSEDFITKFKVESESEDLTIYSIVNTLTENPTIKKVRFLVNGIERKILYQMELQGDFIRDEKIIKQDDKI